jgi:hypothetical protein
MLTRFPPRGWRKTPQALIQNKRPGFLKTGLMKRLSAEEAGARGNRDYLRERAKR